MRVLVACEFSGRVRDAFSLLGHDSWSCDLLPSELPGNHYQMDVLELLKTTTWDLMIAHPPCTHLCVSGARWFKNKQTKQLEAINFVKALWSAPIQRIAIENPIGILSTRFQKPNQIFQPTEFEVPRFKATCLWLKNLPPLISTGPPTKLVRSAVHNEPPGPNRWKNRSRTYKKVATAMANQWGNI